MNLVFFNIFIITCNIIDATASPFGVLIAPIEVVTFNKKKLIAMNNQ